MNVGLEMFIQIGDQYVNVSHIKSYSSSIKKEAEEIYSPTVGSIRRLERVRAKETTVLEIEFSDGERKTLSGEEADRVLQALRSLEVP